VTAAVWLASSRPYLYRRTTVNMDSRLRRLEERAGARCPECAGSEGIVITYDEAALREALDECCPRCGRVPRVIRVVYDDEEESIAIGQMLGNNAQRGALQGGSYR
jgi:Zn finger protein HypA/HybF involved in hydrogenase expression